MSDWTSAKYNKDLPDDDFWRIYNLYKKQVKLPFSKPKKQFVLCPVGLVGSGKTTVIKPLSEKLDLVRISGDELRKLLKENNFNYNRTKEIAYRLLDEFINMGYSIAVDSNCGSDDSQEKIKEAKKRGIQIIWIKIDPPEEFIINKLKNYDHNWLFKNEDEAVMSYYKYKEKYGDFSQLNLPYLYTFDTSKPDLDKQIEEAAEIIEARVK